MQIVLCTEVAAATQQPSQTVSGARCITSGLRRAVDERARSHAPAPASVLVCAGRGAEAAVCGRQDAEPHRVSALSAVGTRRHVSAFAALCRSTTERSCAKRCKRTCSSRAAPSTAASKHQWCSTSCCRHGWGARSSTSITAQCARQCSWRGLRCCQRGFAAPAATGTGRAARDHGATSC